MDALTPVFLSQQLVLTVHHDLLLNFGGPSGERSDVVATVVGYPQQKYAYGDPPPSIAEIGAAYAFAAARFHPFTDGNKRTALGLLELFLAQHGLEIAATNAEKIISIRKLARGDTSESEFNDWVTGLCVPLGSYSLEF